ncbi:MAG: MBOAT family protein [Butyrivibrio sp.]|nr:MBOAT family protein [Butyrivibrio sp.]
MVFSSTAFLFFFLPVTLLVYYLLRGIPAKNAWLLAVSIIFFGWSQPQYVWIILASIIINYLSAILVDRFQKDNGDAKAIHTTASKLVLAISVCANLGLLFYFKYFDFVIESVNSITGSKFELQNIVLPIGISFFTFQGMSYVIDVFRRDVEVQKNPFKTALYIVLFPQLIAGPIVRYRDIEIEVSDRSVSIPDISSGITRFIIGLGKKAIIANTMAEIADGIWTAGISNNTVAIAWLGSIAYSLQIFYDFSGYSDMAIGIGKMLGFHFCENFDRPYISKDITEFWRRWHMSLSTWFRDYVYIPLGGNRKHLYRNLLTIFLLTGLWHGAAWHYVFWGLWNGVFIVIERLLRSKNKNKNKEKKPVQTILSHIYALLVINFGWVLFRADTITDGIGYMKTMLGMGLSQTPGFTIFWYINRWVIFIMIVAVLDITGIFKKLTGKISMTLPKTGYTIIKYGFVFVVFILAIMRVLSGTYNPFIYFQF